VPTPEPTPSSTLADMQALALEGKTCDAASQILHDKEPKITLQCETGEAASQADNDVKVDELDTRGFGAHRTAVAAPIYGSLLEPPAPTTPPSFDSDQLVRGETVQLSWDNSFACPTGTGNLAGCRISLTGATHTGDDPSATERVFGADGYVTQVKIDDDATYVSASYTTICRTGDDERDSDPPASVGPVEAIAAREPSDE